ncbi:MAG: hypothetical protein DIU61_004215 [Bacteroidota bacterium]|jgi:hypothetical protein|nr:MAG: hypothetical protein DIU61_12940 [Bacteroidota bacterium]
MKIKLIQTGGFAGLTRSAEIEVQEEEAEKLIQRLAPAAASHQPSPNVRDAFHHVLMVGDRRIPFSPEEVPEELRSTIQHLIANLS